jgi:hypothetical protein
VVCSLVWQRLGSSQDLHELASMLMQRGRIMREQSKDAHYAYIESSCMCVKNMSNRLSVNVCGACFVVLGER